MKTLKIQNQKIDNLYHPSGDHKPESFDRVELIDCITLENNRFLPVLLKEAFSLIKENGILFIQYNSKFGLTPDQLEKNLWWLFQRKYSIISHILKYKKCLLTIKKTSSILQKNDDISHWSFGMVTNGARKDFIQKSIQSIRELNIPEYEIIICGNYPFKIEKDIKYIPFTDRDDKGWITRKKNIIAKNVKYNNVCIFHDRIVFEKNWFKGMKRYGNSFEVLTCPQILGNGERAGDWVWSKPYKSNGYEYTMQELDYRDWNKGVYVGGQVMIIKKNVWEEVCWNETMYWKEAEDIEYSQRITNNGFITRLNPYSTCLSLSWNFGKLPRREFTKTGKETLLWKLKDVPLRRFVRFLLFVTSRIVRTSIVNSKQYSSITRSNVYKFIINH